jgi:AhpD family alkylhydroperoxidase
MVLENRIKALIAVGASVSANCETCLHSASAMALASGADEQQIAAASEIGKKVRAGAASGMDHFIMELNNQARIPRTDGTEFCGCVSDEKSMEVGKNG